MQSLPSSYQSLRWIAIALWDEYQKWHCITELIQEETLMKNMNFTSNINKTSILYIKEIFNFRKKLYLWSSLYIFIRNTCKQDFGPLFTSWNLIERKQKKLISIFYFESLCYELLIFFFIDPLQEMWVFSIGPIRKKLLKSQ